MHSALRSFTLRGKYLEALAEESRRADGCEACALELILLRKVYANLVTGGVTRDMVRNWYWGWTIVVVVLLLLLESIRSPNWQ
jgi:hypothetical protein